MATTYFMVTDKATVEASTMVYKSKRPSEYKQERYKISTLSRIANGDMVGDVVARKNKFYFTFKAISARELNELLDAIWWNDGMFFYLHVLTGKNAYTTYRVYAGSIPASLHYGNANPDVWIWKDVTVNFIEK